MKNNDAFVKGVSVITIENEKKRAEKEIKILKEELEKNTQEVLIFGILL